MANMCTQILSFTGKKKNVNIVIALFNSMEEACKKTDKGQLPSFLEGNKECRYMFDISVDGDTINFWTKWSPAIETVRQIAEKYKVNFSLEYEELDCEIFGRATFNDGVLIETDLDDADFESYQKTDSGVYTFEGEVYESQSDILEKLLERKVELPLAL